MIRITEKIIITGNATNLRFKNISLNLAYMT